VMLASLNHLLINTIEDARERDPVDLAPIGTTTFKYRTPKFQLLYTTLGMVNKFNPAGAERELQTAFVALWARVHDLDRATRSRGYFSRSLGMILRRMLPVLQRIPRSGPGPE